MEHSVSRALYMCTYNFSIEPIGLAVVIPGTPSTAFEISLLANLIGE